MLEEDSLIKARYARTILRVARTCERETAERLINGLVRDIPHVNERPEIRLHLAAIESFVQLARSLGDPSSVDQRKRWDDATDAARVWLLGVGG